eukprot:1042205-Prymnesium_polylepis.1
MACERWGALGRVGSGRVGARWGALGVGALGVGALGVGALEVGALGVGAHTSTRSAWAEMTSARVPPSAYSITMQSSASCSICKGPGRDARWGDGARGMGAGGSSQGSTRAQLMARARACAHLERRDHVLVIMRPYATVCDRMRPYATVCDRMRPHVTPRDPNVTPCDAV